MVGIQHHAIEAGIFDLELLVEVSVIELSPEGRFVLAIAQAEVLHAVMVVVPLGFPVLIRALGEVADEQRSSPL